MDKNKYKELVQEHFLVIQQINKKQEKLLLQEIGGLFAENPITDFCFEGMNKHILISDNFEISNFEIMISPNGYISITDDNSTVWYQIINESPVQLPYVGIVLDLDWNEFNMDSIINSFASEADVHKFIEALEVEVSILKQRLWLLKNSSLKLVLIEDEKLLQELSALREVA
ncbi:MAG: hypothetical protein ACLSH8_15585 [Zhenhengia sp.]|jgi:hypothetical protein|uniref:hypothetical protein n=1 Tax=Zhenhengia sp. TaxID=2944208 RepID=UPI00290DE0F0|nr:hypothetical protein [Clostridiales bacterium]MDU6974899.1 hypothetical protein [Clostridiales bacterium]